MTSDGTNSYGYDTYNRMTSAPGSASFIYDPQGRLLQASKTGLSTRRFGYDGGEVIGEYSSSNVLATRYVRGPAADEVLVEVDASSGSKTYLHHDERGSVIAGSGSTGAQTFINTYDEFGKPGVLNEGSFQYTGQLYLEETEASGSGSGLYYYKARIYNPDLGRFMQTDPIGYAAGLNLYAYASGDPVNGRDPSGLQGEEIIVPANEIPGIPGEDLFFNRPTGTAGDTFQPDLDVLDQYEDYLEECEKQQALLETPVKTAPTPVIRPSTAPTIPVPSIVATALRRSGIVGLALALSGDTRQRSVDTYRHYSFAQYADGFSDGLRPGSFATTNAGPPLTGSQAQQLLALPHPTAPDSFYQVTVERGTVPVEGPNMVQPAYGQPGGGVEYFFPAGTPPGSVTGPFPVPDECGG